MINAKNRTVHLLFILVVLFGPASAFTQADMRASAVYDGNEVRIRWLMLDPGQWQVAMTEGITLTRTTLRRNGAVLPLVEEIETITVLDSLLLPFTASQWSGNLPNNELATAASGILYDPTWSELPTGDRTFENAVAGREKRENRVFYAHAIADRDWEVARGMALGYADPTAVSGETYFYRIVLNADDSFSTGVEITIGTSSLLPVPRITASATTKYVTLKWPIDSLQFTYGNYDIFRADAGANTFEKVNEAPFLPADIEPEPGRSAYAYYKDSVPDVGDYAYYVVGHSPFGLTGPPSAPVTVTVRPERLRVQLFIDSVAVTETTADLWWRNLAPAYSDSLVALRLFRSVNPEGPFEPAPSGSLASSVRAHSAAQPLPKAYYVLEGEDAHGHRYRSGPKLVQLEDNTPPTTPVGLSGEDDGDGTIRLTWTANTEADLAGYRLYRSADPNATFTEVSNASFPEPLYEDDTQGLIVSDSLYYQLLASDQRGNYSSLTPVYGVKRADRSPPAKPVLLEAIANAEGIALTWRYSGTGDVVRHELQRRRIGSPDWQLLAAIDSTEESDYRIENFGTDGAVNYLDEDELPRREFQYQLIAFDDAGNNAGSEMLTVRPYDDGTREEVSDLSLSFSCADSTLISPLDAATQHRIDEFLAAVEADTVSAELLRALAEALLMNGLITAEEIGQYEETSVDQVKDKIADLLENGYAPAVAYRDCAIHVDWAYPLDASVAQFRLHRSRDGSPLRTYRTLPVEFFFPGGAVPGGVQSLRFTDDESVDAGMRYVYKVEAIHADGGTSVRGSGVTIVVE